MFIKKFLSVSALLVAAAASLSLSACGGGGSDEAPKTLDTSGSASVTELKIVDTLVGNGASASIGSNIKVHYTLWLYDVKATGTRGAQIESSVGKTPLDLKVGNGDVPTGFEQGVINMKVGGKRTVIVPSSMGFGSKGSGAIPPNAALVLDVEFLGFESSGSAAVTELKTVDNLVGTGAVAAAGTTATVHYTGWLYDVNATGSRGTQFDSSVGKTPFSFKVGSGEVIKGWDQGVAGMKVGGKRTLTIPASLGYGATGAGVIPPNAALVFDVELLSVK